MSEIVKAVGACKCVFCGAEPVIHHYGKDMYYVYCSNPNCKKHEKYAYLGRTPKAAIDQWCFMNREMDRTPTQKRKKTDADNDL